MKPHMDKQQMRIHYNKEETHMGSWGIEVLENDTALDLIPSLVKNGSLKRTVERLLLSAEYIDERLLAVEIVDISLKEFISCIWYKIKCLTCRNCVCLVVCTILEYNSCQCS